MSLCVIAAGLPESLFALAVGLLCLGLGFAGTTVSRIVVVSMRRSLRCVAIASAVYSVGDAAARALSSYVGPLRESMWAWIGPLARILTVHVFPTL